MIKHLRNSPGTSLNAECFRYRFHTRSSVIYSRPITLWEFTVESIRFVCQTPYMAFTAHLNNWLDLMFRCTCYVDDGKWVAIRRSSISINAVSFFCFFVLKKDFSVDCDVPSGMQAKVLMQFPADVIWMCNFSQLIWFGWDPVTPDDSKLDEKMSASPITTVSVSSRRNAMRWLKLQAFNRRAMFAHFQRQLWKRKCYGKKKR